MDRLEPGQPSRSGYESQGTREIALLGPDPSSGSGQTIATQSSMTAFESPTVHQLQGVRLRSAGFAGGLTKLIRNHSLRGRESAW